MLPPEAPAAEVAETVAILRDELDPDVRALDDMSALAYLENRAALRRGAVAPDRLLADVNRLVSGGSGLSLAVVSSVPGAHGGRAGVDNRPGEGATFWLEVPR